jgi:hypothetical protein
MSRTPTRRPGRLRALAVVGALAISMIAGAAAPAFADDAREFPGLGNGATATEKAPGAPWNGSGNGVGAQGISWF